MKTALTIAGSDSSGGAGIQADIKTMISNGVYAMSVITALTAQNTKGVYAISETAADFMKMQLDAVFSDIYPDAIKIGMVSSCNIVNVIADKLSHYNAKNIVADPVMIATSGSHLIKNDAIDALCKRIFPIAKIITPNIKEAEVLMQKSIQNKKDMEEASKVLNSKYSCSVLIKGGHISRNADDVLCCNGSITWYEGSRINNLNTHGTGCTLSSAIASNLAKGYSLHDAVSISKEYITGALSSMLNLGKGSGPLNHGFDIKSEFCESK